MKNRIIAVLLVASLVTFISTVCGEPEDVLITIRVPAAKVQAFRAAFLAYMPNNETEPDPAWIDPHDGTTAPEIAKYTDKAWIRESGVRWYKRCNHKGNIIIAQQAQIIDPDIVE